MNAIDILKEYFFSKEDSILKALLGLSVLGMIGEYMPPYIPSLAKYYDVINSLAIGFFITFVFYLINIALPRVKKRVYVYYEILNLLYEHTRFFMKVYIYLYFHIETTPNEDEKDELYQKYSEIKDNQEEVANFLKENNLSEEEIKEFEIKFRSIEFLFEGKAREILENSFVSHMLKKLKNSAYIRAVDRRFNNSANKNMKKEIEEEFQNVIQTSIELEKRKNIYLKHLDFEEIVLIDNITKIFKNIEKNNLTDILVLMRDINYNNYIDIFDKFIPIMKRNDLFAPSFRTRLNLKIRLDNAEDIQKEKREMKYIIIKNLYQFLFGEDIYLRIGNRDKLKKIRIKEISGDYLSVYDYSRNSEEQIDLKKIIGIISEKDREMYRKYVLITHGRLRPYESDCL